MLSSLFKGFLNSINKGSAPAWLQKLIWRSWYSVMAWRWKDDQWSFMNYGWLPANDEPKFALDVKDEPDRAFIGLYYHLSCLVNVQDKKVVEIGSGRGGGASYLARYHKPESVIGLDFSNRAVELSKRLHKGVEGLGFRQGDAENMPFDSATFDVLINVESSHCYGDMPAFVSEVVRVLKPGGYFAWVDIRGPDMLVKTEKALAHESLKLVHDDVISAGVVRALDAAADRKQQAIDQVRMGHAILKQFAAMPGTPLYNGLVNGQVKYLCRVYQRCD